MCMQCVVESETILEDFIPGWSLQVSRKDHPDWPLGHYGFVRLDDPALVFHVDSFLTDPCFGCDFNDDCNKCTDDDSSSFLDAALKIDLDKIGFFQTVKFYNSCVEVGYNKDTNDYSLDLWLMNRIAILMNEKNGTR